MKNVYPFLLLCVLVMFACAKEAQIDPLAAESESCDKQVQARVEFQAVNEDGSEDFYYLVLMDKTGRDIESVFSSALPSKYKEVGLLVDANYKLTEDLHKYVVCLDGHQVDPENPDYSELRVVNLCEVTETKN